MRSDPCRQRACRAALPAILLALLLFAGGCELEDDPPPTPFGPGSGGPALTGTTQPETLTDLFTAPVGQLDYYDGHFTALVFGMPAIVDEIPVVGVLTGADGVKLTFVPIAGRPDTPCRFTAALAARDDDFVILGDGADRINDAGIVFHEVWLNAGATWRRLVCAQLTGEKGVMVDGISTAGNQLETLQVHFVLNSIRP